MVMFNSLYPCRYWCSFLSLQASQVQHKVRIHFKKTGTSVGTDGPLSTSTHAILDIFKFSIEVGALDILYVFLGMSPGDCTLVECSDFSMRFQVIRLHSRMLHHACQAPFSLGVTGGI